MNSEKGLITPHCIKNAEENEKKYVDKETLEVK